LEFEKFILAGRDMFFFARAWKTGLQMASEEHILVDVQLLLDGQRRI
jgi:hypothetical protein